MILKELLAINEANEAKDETSTIEFSAEALTYNQPHFFPYASNMTKPEQLKEINDDFQKKFKNAAITKVYIGEEEGGDVEDEEDQDYGAVGDCFWSATVTMPGKVSKKMAVEIGKYVSGMLFGQYGMGDAGELTTLSVNDVDLI